MSLFLVSLQQTYIVYNKLISFNTKNTKMISIKNTGQLRIKNIFLYFHIASII